MTAKSVSWSELGSFSVQLKPLLVVYSVSPDYGAVCALLLSVTWESLC